MTTKRWVAYAFVVVAIGACGEPTKPPPPAPPVLSSITLSASDVLLDALGATQDLLAVQKDQYGNAMIPAQLVWTSSDTAVVTVANYGGLTAVAPGIAQVRARAGSVISNPATITVAQAPDTILIISGDVQTAPVTEPLPAPIVVELRDRLGHPIRGRRIQFYVAVGNGTVSPDIVESDSLGRASAAWTMGQLATPYNSLLVHDLFVLPAQVQVRAASTPGHAVDLARLSPPVQYGVIGHPLQIQVGARDQFGNYVSGIPVEFAVTAGNGSVNPPAAITTDGVAATSWTIGPDVGPQGVEARSPGLSGSPVVFGILAIDLNITAVTPDTLIEGQPAVVHGTGFDITLTNNFVTLGGVSATITAGTATSLTILVPTADCHPGREVAVRVMTGGIPSNIVDKRVKPGAGYLALQPGEHVIVQDPSAFCLQFASTRDGLDAYLVGVSATAEQPTAIMSYSLRSLGGFSAVSASPPARAPQRVVATPPAPSPLQASHARAEATLRNWEQRNLRTETTPRITANRQTRVPNVGDVLSFRIPTDFSDPCNGFTTIGTRVRAVGSAGIWVTDTLNPIANALTLAEIRAYSDTFDTRIYAVDTTYFGTPSDIDGNQRVVIVLSWQVNRIPLGVAGFVFGGDILPTGCPQSNLGEIFYGHVPDSLNASGNGARRKSSILNQMPSLIAHEFAHNIQLSRRLVLNDGFTMTSWEMEGQATFAEEVVAHSIFGNSPGQNYGASVARLPAPGGRWYEPNFLQVGQYFGWLGGSNRTDAAPELCTLFGTTSIATACSPFAFYGASWSFQRYLSDRFGPSYPGGERGLHRDLVNKNVLYRGVTNINGLDLGVPFETIFADWAAMLYVDDRFAGMGTALTLSSWNVANIFSSLPPALQLVVPERAIGPLDEGGSVRGGSTVYYRLNGTGERSGFALRLRDPYGSQLSGALQPRFWIVRLQ